MHKRSFFSLDWYWLVLVAIIVVSTVVRLWQLGAVPHGLAWDEAAIGYNGYAVITTRRDEWLTRLPVSFRSFGDYKAPLAIYITGVFVTLLGLAPWVVRLPFALAGVAGVMGMAGLGYHLAGTFSINRTPRKIVSLLLAALLCFSPWHLHFSRVAFESGMALTMVVWGVWAWDWSWYQLRNSVKVLKQWRWWFVLLFSVTLCALSLYTYHSAKIVTPLLAILVVLRHWRWQRHHLLVGVVSLVVGLLLLRPLLLDTFFAFGGARFKQASIFTHGDSPAHIALSFSKHFAAHVSPSFLWMGETPVLRHGDGKWGVLLPTTAFLAILGLVFGAYYQLQTTLGRKRLLTETNLSWLGWWRLSLLWIVIGIVPAAAGLDVPHSNRALMALPGFLMLAVAGGWWSWQWADQQKIWQVVGSHGEKKLLAKTLVGTLLLLHMLFFVSYQQHYYTSFARQSAADFMDGYLEAFQWVLPYEKGTEGKPAVDKILFTADYGQAYIYALFVRKTNPIWYQGGSLIKYEFANTITPGDLQREHTVIVGSNTDQLPLKDADHVVYGSDGQPRFLLFVNE